MKLLLNGCSFSANYGVAAKLGSDLGYDEFVNLAIGGSSNRRIIRTTVEYLEHNTVDFVLLGLTFWERQEGAFLKTQPHKDNWMSYNPMGLQGLFAPPDTEFVFDNTRSSIEKYILERYRYDLNLMYLDQLMCDLVMFTAYLEQRNIKYLIFNTCELEYTNYFTNFNSTYQKAIDQNKRIVPLDKFVSNVYLYEKDARYAPNEAQWSPNAIHYNSEEYRHINDYLLNYIRENRLA
jgi:hypothetical protein